MEVISEYASNTCGVVFWGGEIEFGIDRVVKHTVTENHMKKVILMHKKGAKMKKYRVLNSIDPG